MCEKIKSYLHKCCNLSMYIIRIFIFFTELLDVHMCQKVAPATHFRKSNVIQNLSFRRLFYIVLRQIKHLVNRNISAPLFLQLLLPHFIQIISILVCNDLAACITFHRDNHLILFYEMRSIQIIYLYYFISIFILILF